MIKNNKQVPIKLKKDEEKEYAYNHNLREAKREMEGLKWEDNIIRRKRVWLPL